MEIQTNFKKHINSSTLTLYFLLLIAVFLLASALPSYFNTNFIIDVKELKISLTDSNVGQIKLTDRVIHATLHFESTKFYDFLLVDKNETADLLSLLFVIFVIIQLLRINWYWKDKRFTSKLYAQIDALGIVASIMFIFSQVQDRYLHHLVERLSADTMELNQKWVLLILSIVMIVFSVLLKSLSKEGNRLQEVNDLTI
jgi:hypothetical protein